MVERNLAKVDVASSTLVSRSTAQAVTSSLCCMPCHHFPPMSRHFFIQYPTIMSITVITSISKPLNLVWNCFTQPEHIIHWNQASEDWECPKAENDLKVGGKFVYTMSAKDGSMSFDFWGIYDEIQHEALIAYTLGDERKVSVAFHAEGDHVIVTEIFDPEQVHSEELQKAGWQAILDSFKSYCESI